jgi:pyruvate kinase
VDPQDSQEAMTRVGVEAVRSMGLAAPGDRIIITAGVPFDMTGTTNLLKVETV